MSRLVLSSIRSQRSAVPNYRGGCEAKKSSNIKDVYCVPQVKNIEDELIRAMGLKNIEELLNSKSKKDFKRDMLRERNLKSKFESHHFDIQKLWAMNPATPFDKITNHSKKIKI